MRKWWKKLGLLAGGLAGLGGLATSVDAQYPPQGGGYGPPPGMGMGMGGPPPGMGMGGPPPGMGMGGPPPGAFTSGPAYGAPPDFPNAAPPPKDPASPFSVKDEGNPNAFGWDHPPYEAFRFQMSAGYSFLWFKSGNLPTLATSGSPNDAVPGALGQPNTTVLASGSRDAGLTSAFRTTMTYWLIDPQMCCLDTNFFIMEQRSLLTNFRSNSSGDQLFARPYFDDAAGAEAAALRSSPGTQYGSLSDSIRTRFMGAEANIKWFGSPPGNGLTYNFLAGFRFIKLDETYSSYDTTNIIGGASSSISDSFTAYNQYFAGQIGGEVLCTSGRFTMAIGTKVAVGPNNETVKISGQTVQGNLTVNNEGLFAQPYNVGTYHNTQVAILPEAGVRFSVEVTERIHFNAGYTYMYLNNVVRPGDQINRGVTVQPLGGGVVPTATPGAFSFHQSTFDAQMINLSLEFIF